MWITFVIFSAVFLGIYDVCKKQSLKDNAVLVVMLISSGASLVLMSPILADSAFGLGITSGTIFAAGGTCLSHQLWILLKAFIVQASWVCNFYAMKHLPISIVGPVRSSAPAWTLLGAVAVMGERLNPWQWAGAAIILCCLMLYAGAGRKEGIPVRRNKFVCLLIAGTLIGSVSALYDKFLLRTLQIDRMEVQAWFSLYQFLLALAMMLIFWLPKRAVSGKFRFTAAIPLIGIFLTAADFLYFYGLSCDGAMIGIVSLIRRSNVIISFLAGALLFKESNIRRKACILAGMLAGISILCLVK